MGKKEIEKLPKKKLKIEEKFGNFLVKNDALDIHKIPTNTFSEPIEIQKGFQVQTIDLGTSINDLKQVFVQFENREFLIIFVGKNDLEKLKPRVPGCYSTQNAG